MKSGLEEPSKLAADNTFIYFYFYLSKKKGLMFHVNPLPAQDSHKTSSLIFSENIKSYFL